MLYEVITVSRYQVFGENRDHGIVPVHADPRGEIVAQRRHGPLGPVFLDDLAVAANRPVEALQVAVDDEHEVIEASYNFV